MSGLEFVRAIRDARVAPPPMASVFGFVITDVEVNRVVFECTPDESAYNPIGVVHGGLVCTFGRLRGGVCCANHPRRRGGVYLRRPQRQLSAPGHG
jgi:acyl-coenzyme A thioesterase PaaI-like protein